MKLFGIEFGGSSQEGQNGPKIDLAGGSAPTIQPEGQGNYPPIPESAAVPTPDAAQPVAPAEAAVSVEPAAAPAQAETPPAAPAAEAAATDESSLLGGEVKITTPTAEETAADTAAATSGDVAGDINNSGEVKITG